VADEERLPQLDTSVPQTARIWNYLLGGKDNFAVDREVGDQILVGQPDLAEHARLSRAFLVRAVRYLTADAGVRQFLDIGTGLPAANNTHEVAQSVAPDSRVVYDGTDLTPETVEAARLWNESAALPYHLRSPARLARFFDGLELVEPGLVSVSRWRPEGEAREIEQYGAVGRKP
jgi:hypothetical protein